MTRDERIANLEKIREFLKIPDVESHDILDGDILWLDDGTAVLTYENDVLYASFDIDALPAFVAYVAKELVSKGYNFEIGGMYYLASDGEMYHGEAAFEKKEKDLIAHFCN